MSKKLIDKFIKCLCSGKEYIYLHMPKTAGMAIKSAVERSSHSGKFCCKAHSCSYDALSFLEKKLHTFTSIRHPVTWYGSLFNYKMHHANEDSEKDYSSMIGNSFEVFVDDVVYGKNGIEGFMKWNKPRRFKRHIEDMLEEYYLTGAHTQIGFCTLNFLYYTSGVWKEVLREKNISNELLNNYQACVNVKTILKMEQLGLDFYEMTGGEDLDIDLNKKVNKMNSNPYLSGFNNVVISDIYNRDMSIFSLFDYSAN